MQNNTQAPPWRISTGKRRSVLTLLILIPSALASSYVGSVLPNKGATPLELAIIIVYSILFAWISVGFWTALMGWFTLLRRYDRFAVSHVLSDPLEPDTTVRTAVLFPICNEDTPRVMAGIKTIYLSLQQTPNANQFDIHILSDSSGADKWIEEESAWADLVEELGAQGRIFYRNRKVNLKRKSGNVADFCRRHGKAYTYMAVFDADSVMSGKTLNAMVHIMEQRQNIGILQTAPACFGRDTLLGRLQQFANRAYGPMFAAGLHFWQLGDAQYWGHNALIRINPFMRHCGLPRLSGKPPLGGDILSHDFVEAALMRRAGWGVWLAFDLPGSWEENPPNLLSELKRDRRWCQGNLQHLRLLFTEGLFPAHRILFLNGAMSYASALLWFLFLMLSSTEAVVQAIVGPSYFTATKSLFPSWPVWQPMWALVLLATTGVLLFLPKILSYLLIVLKTRQSRLFGGPFRLLLSILLEVLFSALLAPIRMLFHSKFVCITLLGRQIGWGSQQRDDRPTTWWDAARFHGGGTLFGLLWGGIVWLYSPNFFWWIAPIVVPIVLSMPLSVITSHHGLGCWLRKKRLLLIPEETDPAPEIRDVTRFTKEMEEIPVPLGLPREAGFLRALLDPKVNGLRRALLSRHKRNYSAATCARHDRLVDTMLNKGPNALTQKEKMTLLRDPDRLLELHTLAWTMDNGAMRKRWIKNY
ncbi:MULTISPECIES: glucans biosynthesis glucosyltransferase MdoH [unclassified Pseudodesulfovibrio]|uniref:glucans biosynthesis glucosyltransferase MdoH n=1 Tax=unclassified Pseudodesulfovibrio TaxID=2661612 RepID=UPI000FEBDCE0|nr:MULTISPECIES: glucans biosynthesis glucosyltransferase MdoH [unclassified Pseudodesulfovibrio]MCJ2164010.1 glucans biosynthesis glucosyltransferase MdoH [Pseudodesulfovibrio sp. S3-i]RWU05353.1 glucans biosynthesis glucosyltransferase MdoH [Pseudodesulfovibrio sp. S3]